MNSSTAYKRVALLASVLACAHAAQAAADASPSLAGRWDAVVVVGDVEVPFPFVIEGDGKNVSGALFNGERRVESTGATFDGESVTFNFDQYGTKLVAAFKEGRLVGEYQRARGPYPFRAVRASAASFASAASGIPSIEGTWVVSAKSTKGEAAWRFIARQKGPSVEATILRVDGDTGTLSGAYRDGKFILSHFSGARPLLLEASLAEDGSLRLRQNGKVDLLGARENSRAAEAIGVPSDPTQHTRMKEPAEPLRFSFPDINGRIVNHTDDRFDGKVVLVNISGSWCPNCHDEAPFLASLYRRYKAQGLEIVTLSFEEAAQQADPRRLRAFLKTYGIEHTVLIAGEPDQLAEKVPQAENLDAFPTTFVLGRDGRVRKIHTGFPSLASGEFLKRAEAEITDAVERLLAEEF